MFTEMLMDTSEQKVLQALTTSLQAHTTALQELADSLAAREEGQSKFQKALVYSLTELQEGQISIQKALRGRAEFIPSMDPDDPASRYNRLLAIAYSVKAFAIGLNVAFLSARYDDGSAFTWDAGELNIAHADIGSMSLAELEDKLGW